MQYHFFYVLGGKDSIYEVIFVCQGHFQSERSFSRAFGTKKWPSNMIFFFSFIVLISVDTNYNISTMQNYRYKFDTNSCSIIFRQSKINKIHCLCSLIHNLHSGPQRILARLHLQLPLHATKHPQWTSSMHPQLASSRSV